MYTSINFVEWCVLLCAPALTIPQSSHSGISRSGYHTRDVVHSWRQMIEGEVMKDCTFSSRQWEMYGTIFTQKRKHLYNIDL